MFYYEYKSKTVATVWTTLLLNELLLEIQTVQGNVSVEALFAVEVILKELVAA